MRPIGDSAPVRPVFSGRADLHIHTRVSDGTASVRDALEYACSHAGLDVIAITDHDAIEGAVQAADLARHYPLEVIVGEEIGSREGHILGLFLTEPVPAGLSAAQTVAAVHAQGGLAIAAHPFLRGVWWSPEGVPARMGAGAALRRVAFDAVELNESLPVLALANLRARRFNARYSRLPLVGGSDAHVTEAIGRSFTRFPGRRAQELAAAIRAGQVAPAWRPYGPAQYRAYFRLWLRQKRSPRS